MSIANEISRLQQAKADIKSSIENKGVIVPETAKLDDYPDYIDDIQQGSTPNLQSKSVSITANGTTNVTADTGYDGLSDVAITTNVSGGGGGGPNYTLLASKEFSISTTSTSSTKVGEIDVGQSIYTNQKMIYVRIRDKAGYRSGYFYGSDNFFAIQTNGTNASITSSRCARFLYTVNPTEVFPIVAGTGAYAVYANQLEASPSSGIITIYSRYNSTYRTIDGTFKCDVFLLDWPDSESPFVIPA